MKKQSLSLVIGFLLVGFSSFSQNYITQVKPAGSKLWGYANLKGDIIIEAKFEKCFEFSAEGLAAIYDKLTKQFYFINTSGEKVSIEPTDFRLKEGLLVGFEGFSDGLIQIKTGEKWGYMNKEGKMVVAAKYDETSEFNRGRAVVRNGKSFMVIDVSGKETPVESSGIADIKSLKEGMAIYKSIDKNAGFISSDGKIAVPAKYESVGPFSGGLAWAKTSPKTLGYINTKGDWVIKPEYESGKNFDPVSGLARVKKGEQWSFINQKGEIVSITCADSYGDFSEGLADGKKGEKKGFFNSKGEWVIQPQFDGTRDFKNGYAAAKEGEKWGVIDKQGKWVIEPKFDGIKDMELVK